LTQELQELADSFNLDDPAERVGVRLYLILSKQLSLLGLQSGVVPFEEPFSSDACRGALLGTALALVFDEYGEAKGKPAIDAVIAAFSLVFGDEIGRSEALRVLQDSSDGNALVNLASDWAIRDTRSTDQHLPTTPIAFHAAATGMI
jgi:hypothetical protein